MDPFLYFGEVSRDVFDSGVAGHYEVYPFESSLNQGGAMGSGMGMSLDSSVHRAEMNHNAMVVSAMEQYGMRGTDMVGEDLPLYSPFSAAHGHRYQQHYGEAAAHGHRYQQHYGEAVGEDSVPMRQECMGYDVHSRQTRLQEQHLQHEPQQARPARATETRLPQASVPAEHAMSCMNTKRPSIQERAAAAGAAASSAAAPSASPAPTQELGKRVREEPVARTAAPLESTSSKRSRTEKHHKEIRLLCDALAPHSTDVNCYQRAINLYDKYRESGKAAGRPSRPMYAAVVLAMSGDEEEEGDEAYCKSRLHLVAAASASAWASDAPDKRKIWESLVVLLRLVPLRSPQDNLAGSVLSRLFRSINFSSKKEDHDLTKKVLIQLATCLEQGPLAGKAPKTVAACTMHLYCRHTLVGLAVARTLSNSLQVGESTVRTNLRAIYIGGGSGCGGGVTLLGEGSTEAGCS